MIVSPTASARSDSRASLLLARVACADAPAVLVSALRRPGSFHLAVTMSKGMNCHSHRSFAGFIKRVLLAARDCHFDDTPSPSSLRYLLKVEGSAAEWQSRRRLGPAQDMPALPDAAALPLDSIDIFNGKGERQGEELRDETRDERRDERGGRGDGRRGKGRRGGGEDEQLYNSFTSVFHRSHPAPASATATWTRVIRRPTCASSSPSAALPSSPLCGGALTMLSRQTRFC